MRRRVHGQSGMTLIEVLVAMSLLAILSVLGYQAFSNLLISRERLMETSAQWIDLARLFRRIERDLAGLEPTQVRAPSRQRLSLEQAAEGQRLSLPIYSALADDGRERIVYQQQSAGLVWSSTRVEGEFFPLLSAASQVRWRLLLDDGRWVESLSDAPGAQARALEMRVSHVGIGSVTRLWRLP